ncbi:hypothetical protein WHR41_05186 [Cladosporium halotolerans]|uniref:Uncharacterized protein n=1 Tax=Cladosporium halotolerans TaxID=1052096 RepID=A0AB34KNQ7_9PEZI
MGGGAFSNPSADGQTAALHLPRMTPQEYNRLKSTYVNRLAELYGAKNVLVPLEAPGKESYGDIDIYIVSEEEINWPELASNIGAEAFLDRGSGRSPKWSFAVRLDGERSPHPPIEYSPNPIKRPQDPQTPTPTTNEPFAQIDLEAITPDQKPWRFFHGSYPDLAGMLGHVVKNFGFDITERGLRLRLRELDDSGHGHWAHFHPPLDEARLMLCSDPEHIMAFFDLDVARYDAGFATEEHIFEWLGASPFVCAHSLEREKPPSAREKSNWKPTRPMLARFRAWLPECVARKEAENPDDATTPLAQRREHYLDAALAFFGKREQYERMRAALLRRRANETAAHLLRPVLGKHSGKAGAGLSELVRAFRRNTAFREGGPVVLAEAEATTDAGSELYTFLDDAGRELRESEVVGKWVEAKWEVVKGVERERAKKRKGSVAGEAAR